MTAHQIIEALTLRWSDESYLKIPEAPDSADRRGRKIDCLIVSLWASRGFERDAVEIKVSMSDFRHEIKVPEKADWWWRHVHRFWVACPERLSAKVKAELPATWGLLSCVEGKAPKVIVAAPKHKPHDLPPAATIGCMRASADAGLGALRRAEERGRGIGRAQAEKQAPESRAAYALESLTAKVKAFQEASGIDISAGFGPWEAQRLGKAVKILLAAYRDPDLAVEALERTANDLKHQAAMADGMGQTLRKALGMIEPPEVTAKGE